MSARDELAAVLARAGVDTDGRTWEQLLYRVGRETSGHATARHQAERAQAEREEWKLRARQLVEAGFGDDPDQGCGFEVGELDSDELELVTCVRGHTGSIWLSCEVWQELGRRAGWSSDGVVAVELLPEDVLEQAMECCSHTPECLVDFEPSMIRDRLEEAREVLHG